MRIETGPYQPEDDWTGYFIRGDRALGEAGVFNMMAQCLRAIDTNKLSSREYNAVQAAAKLFSEWASEFEKVYEGN